MSVEAGDLTTWSPQIFEKTNAFDLIGRRRTAERAQVPVRRDQKLQAMNNWRMSWIRAQRLYWRAKNFAPFAMIWAFWFVERLRGASAPHV